MASEKTRWVFDEDFSDDEFKSKATDTFALDRNEDGAFTEVIRGGTTAHKNDNESTRMVGEEAADERTVIHSAATDDKVKRNVGFEENIDPVVGWLVVLKGPGKGNSIPIGHGMNFIGRDKRQRCALPFGDTLISNEDHAKIMYEDREFYIAHGSGKNITRVNGKMIPNMVPLENHALIQLSKATTLAFVALCGEDFDWSDLAGDDSKI